MDAIQEAIRGVPEYSEFKTLDELNESTVKLAEENPDIVELIEAGYSRDGRKILALKIGEGSNVALLFGCPHPNEPVGTLMLEYLSKCLVDSESLREELDFTWLIVKVSDPDGLKLNEGWLKGPFTILNYARNYYRPAGDRQVEWTFPIKYKTLEFNSPLPETRALMRLMEEWKPDFIYSLHNAGFGGVYYYISERSPLLYPIYHKIAEDEKLPLSLGEPEVPWAVELAPAIYYMVSTPEYYEYLEKYCEKDPAEVIRTGTDSYDYARRFNPQVLELVTEVPYFYNARIEDQSPTDVSRRKAVLDSIRESWSHYNYIRGIYNRVKGELKLNTRFRESIEYYLTVTPDTLKTKERWARVDPKLDRLATVAELFDNYQVSRFYRLLIVGLLYRMLKEEIAISRSSLVREVYEEVAGKLEEYGEKLESELEYRVIPLRKLVKVQLAAGLYTALYVQVKNTFKCR